MLDKNDFIHSAVVDAQGTIKLIDAKIGMLITLQLLPLAKIWFIVKYFKLFQLNYNAFWSTGLIVSVFTLWVLSLAMALKGLCAIDNPAVHVRGANDCNGSYYRGGLFAGLSLIDSMFNRSNIYSNEDIEKMVKTLPDNNIEIEKALVCEHAKLIYIRSIKLNRLKWSMRTMCVSIVISLICYLLYGVHF